MAKNGKKWLKIGQNGQKWPKMDPDLYVDKKIVVEIVVDGFIVALRF